MGAAYLERSYLSSGRSRREAPQQIVVRVPLNSDSGLDIDRSVLATRELPPTGTGGAPYWDLASGMRVAARTCGATLVPRSSIASNHSTWVMWPRSIWRMCRL